MLTLNRNPQGPPPALGVSSLSFARFGSGGAFGFAVVPGALGPPGTGLVSLMGGPRGAEPEPVPGGGTTCVSGGTFGFVGPVGCAYAPPEMTAVKTAALRRFRITRSILVASDASTAPLHNCSCQPRCHLPRDALPVPDWRQLRTGKSFSTTCAMTACRRQWRRFRRACALAPRIDALGVDPAAHWSRPATVYYDNGPHAVDQGQALGGLLRCGIPAQGCGPEVYGEELTFNSAFRPCGVNGLL